MKILVTGGRGMLGRDLCDVLGREHACRPVGSAEADITSFAAVESCVARERPDLIIHAAAYTDVNGCERDPDRAFRVNALGSWHVALAAAAVGSALFVISTDFVFDGDRRVPYTEFDAPRPINQYGASKRAGEELALKCCAECSIIRTQWLYGGHGTCFPDTMLRAAAAGRRLRVVADQIGAPTYTRDLATKIAALIRPRSALCALRLVPDSQPSAKSEAPSAALLPIYHINNAGACSWHEFAVAVLRGAGLEGAAVEPISSEEWPSPARRPAYSVLRRYALELTGQDDLRPWQDALADYLAERRSRP